MPSTPQDLIRIVNRMIADGTTQDLFRGITDYAKERDLATVSHYFHSRWRVYPQDVGSTALLTADAVADTFGSWTQIVPINTIPFSLDLVGLVIEQVSAATTYHIQLGHSPTAAEPGPNDVSGERRMRIVDQPIARATELLEVRGQHISANNSVWGRMKTASIAADTANISIVLARHVEVSSPIQIWPAFPW